MATRADLPLGPKARACYDFSMQGHHWPVLCVLLAGLVTGGCGGGRDLTSAAASQRRAVAAAPARAPTPPDPTAEVDQALANQRIDVYDPATNRLKIPLVQVGPQFYRDVEITVGQILGVGTATNTSGVFDGYDAASNRLTIPVVRLGNDLYYNALITVGPILSVGGAIDSISVPTDLSQVRYPESYSQRTAQAAQINRDPCRLDIDHVTFPATWLGRYPLPPVQGAPLAPGVERGLTLKDIGLQPGNPAFIGHGAPGAPQGCSGDLHAALDRTIARLRQLGATFFSVTQWRWATERADGSWVFPPSDQTFGALTDADMAYLVQAAHAAGLKVRASNQIQALIPYGSTQPTWVDRTTANLQKWFPAWQAYMAERAGTYQAMGLDIWELGCNACMFNDWGDRSPEQMSLFASEYAKTLDTVRAKFTGQLMMAMAPWLHQTPSVASRIDVFQIGAGAYASFPPDLSDNLSVARYKTLIANGNAFQGAIDLYEPFGKTILFTFGIQSRSDAFTSPGYMEETACTPGLEGFATMAGACVERITQTDFSLQAIAVEASLEMIASARITRSKVMVEVMDYWETDSLMPFTAFPNIAVSVRNKPAEGILKAWFAK